MISFTYFFLYKVFEIRCVSYIHGVSPFELAIPQVPRVHMWLVTPVPNCANIEQKTPVGTKPVVATEVGWG